MLGVFRDDPKTREEFLVLSKWYLNVGEASYKDTFQPEQLYVLKISTLLKTQSNLEGLKRDNVLIIPSPSDLAEVI